MRYELLQECGEVDTPEKYLRIRLMSTFGNPINTSDVINIRNNPYAIFVRTNCIFNRIT